MKFQAKAVALASASSLVAATAVPPQESVQISNTAKLPGPIDVLSAALSELYTVHPTTTLATVTKKSAGGYAAPAPTTTNEEEYGAQETESHGTEPIPLGNGKCFLPCPPPARCIVESIFDCDSTTTTTAPAGYDVPTPELSRPNVSLETIFVTSTITPMFATATWLPTDCPPDATIGPGHTLCLGRPTQVFVETFTKDVVTHSVVYTTVTAAATATATATATAPASASATSAAGHGETY